ncbi:MAG: hypothetical protein KGL39_42690 [Patescibacteria group bacterium]|nr:hypothetical protein [Patescibacteria group bacterium]
MADVSNEQIYAVLLDMKHDLGVVSAQTASHAQTLIEHLKKADALTLRVDLLEREDAMDSGAEKTWRRLITAGVGALSGAVGAVVTHLWHR